MLKEGDHVRFKTWEELCDEYGERFPGVVVLFNGREVRKKLLGDCLGKETKLKETINDMWIVTRHTGHFSPELFIMRGPIDHAENKIRKEIWQQ